MDLLESAGYTGPRHFDFKPPRTEDFDGVWASAAGCMRNYLILRERAAAFRADPAVREALKASRLDQLAQSTLAPGEKLADLLADRERPSRLVCMLSAQAGELAHAAASAEARSALQNVPPGYVYSPMEDACIWAEKPGALGAA